jgi:hypothetical protein
MNFLLIIFLSLNTYAGFEEAKNDSLYQYKAPKKKRVVKAKVIKKRSSNIDISELLEKDKAIYELLKRQEKSVIVRRRDDKVIALTRVRAVLLNSVLAMNIKPSKFVVRITDDESDLEGGELRCLGFSFEKRVPSKCDLLILDEREFKVDVDIWDLDGAEGIIADYFYSGEEKSFLTSSFASFLSSTFSVAKSEISTPIGNITGNTTKNKIMDGLLGVSDNAGQKIRESGEQNLTISYVNSGKEVLIFFNKTLNLSEKQQ